MTATPIPAHQSLDNNSLCLLYPNLDTLSGCEVPVEPTGTQNLCQTFSVFVVTGGLADARSASTYL